MVATRTQEDRRTMARDAYAALPHGGRTSVRLHVTCAKGHRVAEVYETSVGLVYVAPLRGHGHGDRDRFDSPHGSHERSRVIELLEGPDDDALSAWCDCGKRTLSRQALLRWVADREGRVVID